MDTVLLYSPFWGRRNVCGNLRGDWWQRLRIFILAQLVHKYTWPNNLGTFHIERERLSSPVFSSCDNELTNVFTLSLKCGVIYLSIKAIAPQSSHLKGNWRTACYSCTLPKAQSEGRVALTKWLQFTLFFVYVIFFKPLKAICPYLNELHARTVDTAVMMLTCM